MSARGGASWVSSFYGLRRQCSAAIGHLLNVGASSHECESPPGPPSSHQVVRDGDLAAPLALVARHLRPEGDDRRVLGEPEVRRPYGKALPPGRSPADLRLRDDVPVVSPIGLRVGSQGDEQVRRHPFRGRNSRCPGEVPLAGHDGCFGVAQVSADVAARGQVVEAGHVLRIVPGGSGSTKPSRRFLAAASECRVVMSDLSGHAALDRVYSRRVAFRLGWGCPVRACSQTPVWAPLTLRVVPVILAHGSPLGNGVLEEPEGLRACAVSRPGLGNHSGSSLSWASRFHSPRVRWEEFRVVLEFPVSPLDLGQVGGQVVGEPEVNQGERRIVW